MAVLALASLELQIVSSLPALPAEWECGAPAPRARLLVTLWKFNRTSPSDDAIRVPLCVAAAWPADRSRAAPALARPGRPLAARVKGATERVFCPLPVSRGAGRPAFGTMMRSIDGARGLPCSTG